MTKPFFILAFSIILSFPAFSQIDSTLRLSLIKTITGHVDDFTTDNLGNVYIVNASNQLKKLNEKGDSIAGINDVKRFGRIQSIDASNPLKVIVYYKDFSRLAVLDRMLNTINTIDLTKLNVLQMQAFATSYDNNIWIYDELESKIKKIDDKGRILMQSSDLRQVLDEAPVPVAMYDQDGLIYLFDSSSHELFTFDYYGALKNKLHMNEVKDLQVVDKNTLIGSAGNVVVMYKPSTLQSFVYKLAPGTPAFTKIRFSGNKVYGLTRDGELKVYIKE